MNRIRVLIVDDSLVIRRVLAEEVSADPALEYVGSAANGHVALSKLNSLHPHVVVLDVEMPEMNGLETLDAIRQTHPKLPVIMFSSLTERAAQVTLEALARGATDYATKPRAGGLDAAREVVRNDLLAKIKAVCGPPEPRRARGLSNPTTTMPASVVPRLALKSRIPTTDVVRTLSSRIELVAIGASTGGPNALTDVFRALPADLPVPIVIVQHMPPVFTELFAKQLTSHAKIPVHEAKHGDVLRPGHAWLAPGDFHLEIERDGAVFRAALHQGPPENSCRPAVDVLFRSAARIFGRTTLAVVLTGMGKDGADGARSLREAGASVIVQDEATSVVWGMPGAVVRAELANSVLPLQSIAGEIVRCAAFHRRPTGAH